MATETTITVNLTPKERQFLYKVCKEYKESVKFKGTMMGAAMACMTGIAPKEENKDILMGITKKISKTVESSEQENLKIAQDLMSTFRQQ